MYDIELKLYKLRNDEDEQLKNIGQFHNDKKTNI